MQDNFGAKGGIFMSRVIDIREKRIRNRVLKSGLPAAVIILRQRLSCFAVPLCGFFEHLSSEYATECCLPGKQGHKPGAGQKYHVKASSTIVFFQGRKGVFCKTLSGYTRRPELKCVIEDVIGNKCECLERNKTECDVLILGGEVLPV